MDQENCCNFCFSRLFLFFCRFASVKLAKNSPINKYSCVLWYMMLKFRIHAEFAA